MSTVIISAQYEYKLILPYILYNSVFSAVNACVHGQSLHLCPNLCDPTDCSLPDSSIHGILQVRILE